MPFIVIANDEIPNGVLQILDLFPNVSLHHGANFPPGQTRYLRRAPEDLVEVDGGTGEVVGVGQAKTVRGLGAFLVDCVPPPGQWDTATVQNAVTLLRDAVKNGDNLTVGDVNALLGVTLPDAGPGPDPDEVDGGDAAVKALLSILSGRCYETPVGIVPAYGTLQDAQGGFTKPVEVWTNALINGEWGPRDWGEYDPNDPEASEGRKWVNVGGISSRPEFTQSDVTTEVEICGIRHTLDTDEFQISLAAGQLARLTADAADAVALYPRSGSTRTAPGMGNWQTAGKYRTTKGRVVTVYDDEGNCLK